MAEIVYENKWFRVSKDGNYHHIEQGNGVAGCVVVALIGGKLVLLEQARHPLKFASSLEFPRGGRDENESSVDCAIRELAEETNISLTYDQIQHVGSIHPDTGLLSSLVDVYVGIAPEADLQISDESVGIMTMTVEEFENKILTKEIKCGVTLAAYLLAKINSDIL